MIIGIDPGSSAPRHVRLGDLVISESPLLLGATRAWVEGQWVPRATRRWDPKRRRFVRTSAGTRGLMTLSFWAGLHAGPYLAWGAEVWSLPVATWRGWFDEKEANLDKTVWQNRYRRGTPGSVWDAGPDAVDAWWIGTIGELILGSKSKAELKALKVKRITWIKRK